MSTSLLFWILMLLWLICGPWPFWGTNTVRPYAFNLLMFVLLGILGWHCFGAPLHNS